MPRGGYRPNSGRKPKPIPIKMLEGNPGKRPLPKVLPFADVQENQGPKCPKWLDADAKKEWKRIIPELQKLELTTGLDMAAMTIYCESWAQYKRAIEFIKQNGETYVSENGLTKAYPQVSIANKAAQQIKSICAEYGMTASARLRMQFPGKADVDDGMEALLKPKK